MFSSTRPNKSFGVDASYGPGDPGKKNSESLAAVLALEELSSVFVSEIREHILRHPLYKGLPMPIRVVYNVTVCHLSLEYHLSNMIPNFFLEAARP